MKKIICFFCIVCIGFCSFAKELVAFDRKAVNKVLDARLYINDFETYEEKISYLEKVQHEIEEISGLSAEAEFICKKLLGMQKETVFTEDELKQSKNQKRKNFKSKETESLVMTNFEDFLLFEENHPDLSAHFYLRKLEAEMATLPFLPANKQIKFLSGLLDTYRSIEEMEENYSEILFTLSTILYVIPKIAGGSKEEATEKCLKAIETATCDYEKTSSLVMYSQILFEAHNYEESKSYLNAAIAIAPANVAMKEIKKMNEAGYSMFRPKNHEKMDMNYEW